MTARALRAGCLAAAAVFIAACGSVPTAEAPIASSDGRAQSPDRLAAVPQSPFEQTQRDRALAFTRQRRLADAAIVWEVLVTLRPDVAEYRERLADAQRAIAAAVAEQTPRAAQAAQRGDIDAATQQYLAILALQSDNQAAADALRTLELERNRRNYLGKYSRITITRRSMADAEMSGTASQMSGRIDVEHASLLASDGEFDDAIAMLERRLVVDRRDAAARRLLANVYFRKAESLLPRDPPGAIAALEKSVRLDPGAPGVATRLKELKAKPPAPTMAASAAPSRPGR